VTTFADAYIDVPEKKWCVGCGRIREASEFGLQIRDGYALGKPGLKGRCRPCAALAAKNRRAGTKNPFHPEPDGATPEWHPRPPGVPVPLVAKTTPGKVTLSWAAPDTGPPVDWYEVFRDGAPVAVTSKPGWVDTSPGVGEHEYRVAAVAVLPAPVNGEIRGDTATVTVTALPELPGKPRNVRAVRNSPQEVTVTWDPPVGGPVDRYRVSAGVFNIVVAPDTARTVTFPVAPGATVTVEVAAQNTAGMSPAAVCTVPGPSPATSPAVRRPSPAPGPARPQTPSDGPRPTLRSVPPAKKPGLRARRPGADQLPEEFIAALSRAVLNFPTIRHGIMARAAHEYADILDEELKAAEEAERCFEQMTAKKKAAQ
jgi:hypothetical protein